MWRRRATVNQLYISESVLSKGVQLLFKTATFYLIFIPGLSLLFPLCHAATHLHESFREGRRRRRRCASSPPSLSFFLPFIFFLLPLLARNNGNSNKRAEGTTTTTTTTAAASGGTTAQARTERRSIFNALFACCSVPTPHLRPPHPLPNQAGVSKWSRQSVIREPGFAPCHKDDMV